MTDDMPDDTWEDAWDPLYGVTLPPARSQPKVETIRSSDLEHTICVHELAFGIAIASGADPAADEVRAAITQFAHRVLEWIDLTPPCEHKEAR